MKITFKKLVELAQNVSERNENHEFHVNKRNGYYVIDYFTKYPESEYRGYLKCGSAHEIYCFLRGMLEASWLK